MPAAGRTWPIPCPCAPYANHRPTWALCVRGLRWRISHTLVAQQGIELRGAATKGGEIFQGAAAATALQDFLQIALAGGTAVAAIGTLGFFKSRVGIGREHLRPFVAVVACSVTASKDVAEGIGAAVVGRGGQHSHFVAHGVEQSW